MISFTITGAPRSGTSLLSSLVNAHPAVRVAHDSGLFYYLKFALLELLLNAKTGRTLDFSQIYMLLPSNNLGASDWLRNFLQASPAKILACNSDDQRRILMDRYLYYLWKFWTHDFNIPDPTKDRHKSSLFLKALNLPALLDAPTFMEAIFICVKQLADAQAEKNDTSLPLLYGEKTPDNAGCGDIINLLNPDMKVIHIMRDPVSLYGARKRRGLIDDPLQHCLWYEHFAILKEFKDNPVMTIHYEDLVANTQDVMALVYDFLVVEPIHADKLVPSAANMYRNYVGASVDPGRDAYSRSLVEPHEANVIRSYFASSELLSSN